MEVEVNGSVRQFDDVDSVDELIEGLDIDGAQGVAVAVNDEVVPRGRWESTPINDGDRVEIIRATQGG